MKRCLIVDDSKVIRSIAKKMIEELGFETNEAENGKIALELCRKAMPDAILLDWNMPEMSGMEFLQALRSESKGSMPKIIFCTTKNEIGQIREAILAGADEYIMKPFDKEILQAKLMQTNLV